MTPYWYLLMSALITSESPYKLPLLDSICILLPFLIHSSWGHCHRSKQCPSELSLFEIPLINTILPTNLPITAAHTAAISTIRMRCYIEQQTFSADPMWYSVFSLCWVAKQVIVGRYRGINGDVTDGAKLVFLQCIMGYRGTDTTQGRSDWMYQCIGKELDII